jgi:hypothetical protein
MLVLGFGMVFICYVAEHYTYWTRACAVTAVQYLMEEDDKDGEHEEEFM